MTTETFEVPSPLERLMNDTRVRVGGLIGGALIILISLVVVNVSNAPSRAPKSVAVLPAAPLNIPIMRQWPYPAPKAQAGAAQTVRAAGAKPVNKRFLARR